MTVCIALINLEKREPRIIVCADTLLDGVSTSAHDIKVELLGWTFFAMMSGDDWKMATELAKRIRERIRSQGAPSKLEVLYRTVKDATAGFKSSPFCGDATVDLIVGGFIGREPILMTTGFYKKEPYTDSVHEIAVVGSGAQIAESFLRVRGYNANTVSWRVGAYFAYEAKKYSENAPSVGKQTCFDVFVPNPDAPKEGQVRTAWPADSDVLDRFERCRTNVFGLKPVFEGLLPNLPSPTDDLSDRLTSPGSSE